jgi:hypothetical protein
MGTQKWSRETQKAFLLSLLSSLTLLWKLVIFMLFTLLLVHYLGESDKLSTDQQVSGEP